METKQTTMDKGRGVWCLNRTMQYGNEDKQNTKDDCRIRLNRTMQYGNVKETVIHTKIVMSLNRTMQYGNSNSRAIGGRHL